jgi:hypothetical protein
MEISISVQAPLQSSSNDNLNAENLCDMAALSNDFLHTEPWRNSRWARKTMATSQNLYANITSASNADDFQVIIQPL